jgi:hypothetical protein
VSTSDGGGESAHGFVDGIAPSDSGVLRVEDKGWIRPDSFFGPNGTISRCVESGPGAKSPFVILAELSHKNVELNEHNEIVLTTDARDGFVTLRFASDCDCANQATSFRWVGWSERPLPGSDIKLQFRRSQHAAPVFEELTWSEWIEIDSMSPASIEEKSLIQHSGWLLDVQVRLGRTAQSVSPALTQLCVAWYCSGLC